MKKFLVLILTICLCSLFLVKNGANVKACDRPIYYITDNPDCEEFKCKIMDRINCDIILDYANGKEYDKFISNDFISLCNIENAYVIFEVTTPFEEMNDAFDPFPCLLKDLFMALKENNNMILFICGTNESRYLSKNDFLDYVDFHINTDVSDVFIQNIFYQLEQNNGNPPQNADLIINKEFLNLFGGYNVFRQRYVIPYVNSRYYDYLQEGHTLADALSDYSVRIYIESSVVPQYVYINNIELNIDLELYDFDRNGNLYCVGATSENDDESYQWLNNVYQLNPEYLFYYKQSFIDMSSYTFEDNQNLCCFSKYAVYPTLLDMTVDFLTLDISYLTNYDNYSGRCKISHIMINFASEDGWLNVFTNSEDGDFENCWDKYNEVKYEIYTYDDDSLYIEEEW